MSKDPTKANKRFREREEVLNEGCTNSAIAGVSALGIRVFEGGTPLSRIQLELVLVNTCRLGRIYSRAPSGQHANSPEILHQHQVAGGLIPLRV
jgi:hypothetical protein